MFIPDSRVNIFCYTLIFEHHQISECFPQGGRSSVKRTFDFFAESEPCSGDINFAIKFMPSQGLPDNWIFMTKIRFCVKN